MYVDAESSDRLDIALLLETETKNKRGKANIYYMLGQCLSLGRGWLGERCGFVGFLGGFVLLRVSGSAEWAVWGGENKRIQSECCMCYTGR
jgi:hypothetical protein